MTYSNGALGVIDLLQDRPVAYHPALARALGSVKEAIFLGQLLYWHGKGKRKDGWIWKTAADMEEETALSRNEQVTARRNLIKKGLMEERRMGVPGTMHYRVLISHIVTFLHCEDSTLLKTTKQDVVEVKLHNDENHKSIPESTTETTTKITESKKSPPKKKARTKSPPAVLAFRRAVHRYPPKSWYADIDKAVGDNPADLERFENICKSWVGRGYNPGNIEGMLDCYAKGSMGQKKNGRDVNDDISKIISALATNGRHWSPQFDDPFLQAITGRLDWYRLGEVPENSARAMVKDAWFKERA